MFSIGLFSPAKHALSRSLMATNNGHTLSTSNSNSARSMNHLPNSEPEGRAMFDSCTKRRALQRNFANYFMVGITWGATRR